tara:strand:+ start:103 stop:864 length:762 start_codon:yes stop_codon:yes gene_type:complete
MKLFSVFIFIVFSLSNSFGNCNKEKVILGYDDWRPYQYTEAGKITGLDVDLLSAILKSTGCPFKLKSIGWKAHLRELKKGRVHLAPGASMTDERKKFAFFSESYRTESVVMFVRKENLNKFKPSSLKDLIGKKFKLGVVRGNFNGDEFEKLKKNAGFKKILLEMSSEGQLYKMLRKGRVSGVLADRYSGFAYLKKLKLGDQIVKHPLKVYSTNIHVMFSKKSVDKGFVEVFNKNLQKLKNNGQYKNILNKYLE